METIKNCLITNEGRNVIHALMHAMVHFSLIARHFLNVSRMLGRSGPLVHQKSIPLLFINLTHATLTYTTGPVQNIDKLCERIEDLYYF